MIIFHYLNIESFIIIVQAADLSSPTDEAKKCRFDSFLVCFWFLHYFQQRRLYSAVRGVLRSNELFGSTALWTRRNGTINYNIGRRSRYPENEVNIIILNTDTKMILTTPLLPMPLPPSFYSFPYSADQMHSFVIYYK